MVKKLLALFVASVMTLGVGAVMPESVSLFGGEIEARAESGVSAVTGNYNGIEYYYFPEESKEESTAYITKYTGDAKYVTIPANIEGVTIEGIEMSAFYGCNSIENLTISNGIIFISDSAFSHCESLVNVTIGDSVTGIGMAAFSYCTNLKTIQLPSAIDIIGYRWFACCDSLEKVTIPYGVDYIGSEAFYGCQSLSSINIPNSVTSLGTLSFFDCNSLTSVTLPNSVTSIYYAAFANCTGLKSITIPNSVSNIDDDAFRDCKNLTIKCYSGSVAEQYAKDNNIKYELLVPPHTHSYTSKVVKPTYISEGYTLHTCSCGESYKDNITAKLTRTSIAKAAVSSLSNMTYTGKSITQTPVVKLGSKTLKSGTDYTVSYKNNKNVGTATVTITGKGAYTGTVKATFKICPKKTTIKKVTSPKTKQLKVTYSKVAGVTGYQVTYSTSSKFTKKTTKSANAAGTSKTISKLTKGKTYYVKVRTYKTVGGKRYYSGYSAVKKVKVK